MSSQNEDILASRSDQILIKISNTNIPFNTMNSLLNNKKENKTLLVHNGKDYAGQEMKIYKDIIYVEIIE